MLPKKYRLQKDKDFELVFRKGKIISNRFFYLKSMKNNLETSRFGFIVGKKTSKNSTDRNIIKRRLREAIWNRLEKIKPGFDMVIITKPDIVGKNYRLIDEAVKDTLCAEKLI